jgi:hypothetical protein
MLRPGLDTDNLVRSVEKGVHGARARLSAHNRRGMTSEVLPIMVAMIARAIEKQVENGSGPSASSPRLRLSPVAGHQQLRFDRVMHSWSCTFAQAFPSIEPLRSSAAQ